MNTVLKAAAAYIIVLFVIRLIGRRTASQQAPIDMVVLFLFGGLSVSAVLGDDRSFVGAMSALFTVGLMHVAVSWLKLRFVWFERIVDGTPIVVFRDGRWNETAMRRLRMQQADIRTAARQEKLDDLDKVAVAVVERDGTVSILEKE
ncbi:MULTISPECIES: YetF domain-containing protein [Methylobacterium]|jgi:uncharacterized membrane protein YcaP (DUF421 family)|uniref:Predicted membrane protein n=2 Tax=Methylobacterium TaxID=407 RepID=A0A0C6FET3_9HYPH|nr:MULTISPECIES: YetF domain-containing protein [Methylobacterium]MBK3396990.1 DUF421 domain-containing protein [Methylobacterium ajmalii]MBK3409649.1 DUF421 domain-containing protein [Methylobacterium ajmalii]MBK3423158.1 DUF421 domain-containing protein [Methylobacterium ajmalii]MBZ6411493.1 DUF421 domain-containing protein [Methylobacterium sp.]SFE61707.1 Protein of unknown function [Methylobacterium sp. yr596]